MKKTLLILTVAFASVLGAMADNSATAYINNTNNTVAVAGSSPYVNTVAAASTNYFNLSTTMSAQANTNLWPACPLMIQDNIYNPSRILTYQDQFSAMAANSGTYVKRFAGSTDGVHWQTNPCPIVISETANGTANVQVMTNIDLGAIQYISIYSMENPGAAAITNQFIGTGFDRGL